MPRRASALRVPFADSGAGDPENLPDQTPPPAVPPSDPAPSEPQTDPQSETDPNGDDEEAEDDEPSEAEDPRQDEEASSQPAAGLPQGGDAVSIAAGAAGMTPAPSKAVGVHYRSRISVVDAWRYDGALAQAPSWVDRNWIGYSTDDELRGIPAGPCLRVPGPCGLDDGIRICRVGDYVVRQQVTLLEGLESPVLVEVWPKHEFEKLFLPVDTPQPPNPQPHPDPHPVVDHAAAG